MFTNFRFFLLSLTNINKMRGKRGGASELLADGQNQGGIFNTEFGESPNEHTLKTYSVGAYIHPEKETLVDSDKVINIGDVVKAFLQAVLQAQPPTSDDKETDGEAAGELINMEDIMTALFFATVLGTVRR